MQPITMTLPLRGEWMTPNTPGSRVPSHGTDLFGARYAYDFIQVDWTRRGLPAYRGSLARYLFRGVAVEDYYCWDAPVYAPCDGGVWWRRMVGWSGLGRICAQMCAMRTEMRRGLIHAAMMCA